MTFQIMNFVSAALTQPPPNNMKLRPAYGKQVPQTISLSRAQSMSSQSSVEHRDANNTHVTSGSFAEIVFRDDASSHCRDVVSECGSNDGESISCETSVFEGDDDYLLVPATPVGTMPALLSPPPLRLQPYENETDDFGSVHKTDSFDDGDDYLPYLPDLQPVRKQVDDRSLLSLKKDSKTVTTVSSAHTVEEDAGFAKSGRIFRHSPYGVASKGMPGLAEYLLQVTIPRATKVRDVKHDNEGDIRYESREMTIEAMQKKYCDSSMVVSTFSSSRSILSSHDRCCDLSASEEASHKVRHHPIVGVPDKDADVEFVQGSEVPEYVEIVPRSLDGVNMKKMLDNQMFERHHIETHEEESMKPQAVFVCW